MVLHEACCDHPLYGSPLDPFICISCGNDVWPEGEES